MYRYIVWHTAADPRNNGQSDTTRDEIDRWHKAQGWSEIGYHFVVRLDGRIETGRALGKPGAHTRGINSVAIGICFSGHGDLQPLTPKQLSAGIKLTKELMARYQIPIERVIGHREVNTLVAKKVLSKDFIVRKTCPGKKVDMDRVRRLIEGVSPQ